MFVFRKIVLVAVLVSLSLGIVGCGGGDEKGTPPPAGFDPNATSGLASIPEDVAKANALATATATPAPAPAPAP